MATTQEIVAAARELGKLIETHEAAKKFAQALEKLEADVEARRVMDDFNRQLAAIAEKEQSGKPIEVEDKHKLQELQNKITRNPLVQQFQLAQMDYLDLLRKVDEAMTQHHPAASRIATG